MATRIVKGFGGVFLNRTNLMAVVCILSFVAGVAYTNAGRPMPLFNTTVTGSDADTQPSLNEAEIKTEPEQTVAEAGNNPAVSPLPGKTAEKNDFEITNKPTGQWHSVRMRVTGYCPCSKCCGKYADGITACGHKIRPGDNFVAADRRYSFGTEMIIEGYNNGQPIKVLDRGGAIRGNKLDAFFHTHKEALQWGVKYIDVKVRSK